MLSAIVVMGVTSSGKSTVGAALAEAFNAVFVDADDLHPQANIAKMTLGVPLTDEDRWPWLRRVGEAIAEHAKSGGDVVVACSALRRVYRDAIRQSAGNSVYFVHLHGEKGLIEERMSARANHFMPGTLLGSQLDLLEPLESDELGVVVAPATGPPELVELITRSLNRA